MPTNPVPVPAIKPARKKPIPELLPIEIIRELSKYPTDLFQQIANSQFVLATAPYLPTDYDVDSFVQDLASAYTISEKNLMHTPVTSWTAAHTLYHLFQWAVTPQGSYFWQQLELEIYNNRQKVVS